MSSTRPVLDIATIAFDVPWLVAEQIRLLDARLADDHQLTVFDNSREAEHAAEIRRRCLDTDVRYARVEPPGSWHEYALNVAVSDLQTRALPYWAFLDHDVFPRCSTRLIPLIEAAGFFGLGQLHPPSRSRYLWPGLACFSRSWLGGRVPDFRGIRGASPADNGDTGSMLSALFDDRDWERLARVEHAYRPLRAVDDAGVQSWGVELIGDWVHALNGSGWKAVPAPHERTMLLKELVAAL